MWKLPLSLLRTARRIDRESQELRLTLQRLEIAHRRLQLADHELQEDLLRLSERLSRVEGRALGGRSRRPHNGSQLSLDEIPRGDKAALRAALLPGLKRDDDKEH